MLTVVLIMTAGMVAGYLLRQKRKLISLSERLTTWAIYLLLFLLGIAIGTNDEIIRNLHTLGVKALAITIGGVLGSILLAWVTYHFLFKKDEEKQQ
ncbi:MAG: LysO family transporter [Tenuifilaceae bacterium]|jgi:uncharacterized membrane protein YbjE (DUF340 family)|nr:LysO family transporter [Tenuifilaceae bacterium]